MRYRPPKQLHASLYMRDKKSSADSEFNEEARGGKTVSNKKTSRGKK